MGIPFYLAMTAAEFAVCRNLPPQVAWLACHFSSSGPGLTNIPTVLPSKSVLTIDDSQPFCNKLAKADVETQVYTEFNEQFQAIAWIILLLLLVEMLILERKNPLFKNIHLFSDKKK